MRTNSLAACSYKSLVEVVCLYCYQEDAILSWVEEKTAGTQVDTLALQE